MFAIFKRELPSKTWQVVGKQSGPDFSNQKTETERKSSQIFENPSLEKLISFVCEELFAINLRTLCSSLKEKNYVMAYHAADTKNQ